LDLVCAARIIIIIYCAVHTIIKYDDKEYVAARICLLQPVVIILYTYTIPARLSSATISVKMIIYFGDVSSTTTE